MIKLICDICGTSYPETEGKCPTCGYSRAFLEFPEEHEEEPAAREKVRGGRFSRKNVQKRLKEGRRQQEEAAVLLQQPLREEEEIPASAREPDETAAPVPVVIPAPEPEQREEIPVEEPAAAAVAQATEEPEEIPVVVPAAVPAAVPAEISAEPEQPEETPAVEPEEEEEFTMVLPAAALPEETPETSEKPEKKKKKGLFVKITLVLALLAAVLLAGAFLADRYGIIDLGELEWPIPAFTQPTAAPTEAPTPAPTEPPTQAPTDPPTQPPTDPPTEPPTEPPTDPPTEPPTDPPTEPPTEPPTLAIPLTLNYYELTFRGSNQGVQMEVEGYDNADITWTSDDPNVVTISDTGFIISIGPGTTYIRASYGGEVVICYIRCIF